MEPNFFLFGILVTFIVPIAEASARTVKLYDDSKIVLSFQPHKWKILSNHLESIDAFVNEGKRICDGEELWQVEGRAVGDLQETRNRNLSEKRASAALAILVRSGVDKSKIFMRISGSDYGRFDVLSPDSGHRVEVRRVCRFKEGHSK
jgi:hypothetical protein